MATITIPKKLIKNDDLIIMPRKDYEALLELKKIRTFMPTRTEKKAVQRGRKNFKNGNYVTLEQLKNELAGNRR